MLCKCYWIVLYIVHFTAFCLGGAVFSGHGVFDLIQNEKHYSHSTIFYSNLLKPFLPD